MKYTALLATLVLGVGACKSVGRRASAVAASDEVSADLLAYNQAGGKFSIGFDPPRTVDAFGFTSNISRMDVVFNTATGRLDVSMYDHDRLARDYTRIYPRANIEEASSHGYDAQGRSYSTKNSWDWLGQRHIIAQNKELYASLLPFLTALKEANPQAAYLEAMVQRKVASCALFEQLWGLRMTPQQTVFDANNVDKLQVLTSGTSDAGDPQATLYGAVVLEATSLINARNFDPTNQDLKAKLRQAAAALWNKLKGTPAAPAVNAISYRLSVLDSINDKGTYLKIEYINDSRQLYDSATYNLQTAKPEHEAWSASPGTREGGKFAIAVAAMAQLAGPLSRLGSDPVVGDALQSLADFVSISVPQFEIEAASFVGATPSPVADKQGADHGGDQPDASSDDSSASDGHDQGSGHEATKSGKGR